MKNRSRLGLLVGALVMTVALARPVSALWGQYFAALITGSINCSGPIIATGNITTAGSVTAATATARAFDIGAAGAGGLNNSGVSIKAKSFDGASQSSGCVVLVYMDSAAAGAEAVFTSTIASINFAAGATSGLPGVLLETCSPGSRCRVGIEGVFRVKAPAATNMNNYPNFSTSRCRVDGAAAWNGYAVIGSYMSRTQAADDSVWLRIGQ